VAVLGELVRRAASERQAVYPLGGGTMLDYGLPPTRPGVAVDLRGFAEVIDYPARDMTITTRAGITIARLQEVLAGENQRLPVDVPQPERATLGGALATNTSGPRRYGFGTLRDYIIGISLINDEGQEGKAGGRVVKNVAGYDLCKLSIGSLGTLGIITQVTLKLKPQPEEQALLALRCEADEVGPLLDRLHASRTRPVCVELLNEPAVRALNREAGAQLPEAPWIVVVGFEDNRDTVAWQIQQLIRELPTGPARAADGWVGYTSNWLWRALVEFRSWLGARLTFKANLLPRAVAEFCRKTARLPQGVLLQAHAGNGIVLGHVGATLTLPDATAMLTTVRAAATAAQGNVVLLRCPPEWKKTLPVWGEPRGDLLLMRRVKKQLDPRGLFNPGRFVDAM
jgi:glycolate oxidase FAD binding subunit